MVEDRLAARFASQYGLLTRDQAMAAGATRRMIDGRLASGRWVRVASGVYRLSGTAVTWNQRALAACLASGPEAVLSHRSAAVLFGVSGFRPGPLDITVPPHQSARSSLARAHRRDLHKRDRAVRERVPVTAPARMVADLAHVTTAAVSRRRWTTCSAGGSCRSTN